MSERKPINPNTIKKCERIAEELGAELVEVRRTTRGVLYFIIRKDGVLADGPNPNSFRKSTVIYNLKIQLEKGLENKSK